MSKEAKEVVKTTTTTDVAPVVDMGAWGDVVVESKDLILPKILLQQALSEAVKSRVARDGDYYNTLLDEVCSDENGQVKVLPFYCRQSYVVEKYNGKKFEYHKTLAVVPGEQKPFEEDIDGIRYKNTHVYEFFCLTEDGGTPALVPFKSTSHRTGKKLFNLMYLQNPQQKKTPAHNWIVLGSKQDSNDMGTYNVMEFTVGRESTKEEIVMCQDWIKTIKQSEFKVAEERVSTQTAPAESRF